jgi:hypothetical protein
VVEGERLNSARETAAGRAKKGLSLTGHCLGTREHLQPTGEEAMSGEQGLGHVQQSSPRRLRSWIFSHTPPRAPEDGRVVPSREDDGGVCSNAKKTAPAALYDGGRRPAAEAGFTAAWCVRGKVPPKSSYSRHFLPLI